MKNLMVIITGVIVSFILFTLVSIFVMNFGVEPYTSFGTGTFAKSDMSALQNKIVIINNFIVVPVISLIVGIVVSYLANKNEYILGLFSIMPIVITSFDGSLIWLSSLIVIILFTVIGTALSMKMKKNKIDSKVV